MDVSVIMTTYFHERFIRQALDSILAQKTDYTYEVIIGDDGSADQTRAILQEYAQRYPDKIRPLFREVRLGMQRNAMDCAAHGTGRYLAFLEGDDYWSDETRLQKQVDFLDSHPAYVAVGANWNIVGLDGTLLRKGREEHTQIRDYTWEMLQDFGIFSHISTVLCRNVAKPLLAQYGDLIRRYIDLPLDTSAVLLALQFGKLAILPDTVSSYRWYIEENGKNWSSQNEIAAQKNNFLYFFRLELLQEKLMRELGYPADLQSVRLREFQKLRGAMHREPENRQLRQDCRRMLREEPRKLRFLIRCVQHHLERTAGK